MTTPNNLLHERLNVACKQLSLSFILNSAVEDHKFALNNHIPPLEFLCDQLEKECDGRLERRTKRRTSAAQFPQIKTLDTFDFTKSPNLPETLLRTLATGSYFAKAESIIFLGDPGTGKTHLATALGYAAAQDGATVRFITASKLANTLIEAKNSIELQKHINYFSRLDLLIIDELGYLPLARTDAELMFQVFSERHELKPVIITTNLPFSEWLTVFTDRRLCTALIDRLTYRSNIIETGSHSTRLSETLKLYEEKTHKPEK